MPPTAEETIVSQYEAGYKANLNLAPQQTETKLLSLVDSEMGFSSPGTEFNADDIAPSDPEDVTTRVPDTPDKFNSYTRRIGFFTEFHDAAWIDNVDKTRELEDPTSKIMMTLSAGRWRKVDTTIIAGALGPAYERPNGMNTAPTTVNFPATQLITAANLGLSHQDEIVPDDGSEFGLSVGKIIAAGLKLDDSEIDGATERFFVAGPMQKADLLRRTPTTNEHYREVKALTTGQINEFLGFKFVWLPRSRLPFQAPVVANGFQVRRCIAFVKPAIVYKGRSITEASINIRADKSNTPQAFYKAQHGVSRRYDSGVVEVDCLETA